MLDATQFEKQKLKLDLHAIKDTLFERNLCFPLCWINSTVRLMFGGNACYTRENAEGLCKRKILEAI